METRVKKYGFLLILALIFVALFFFGGKKVSAEPSYIDESKFLPNLEMENTQLISAQGIYYGEKYTAINDKNNKIIVFDNLTGKQVASFETAKTFGQIKGLNSTDMLIIEDKSIYRLYFEGDELKDQLLLDQTEKPLGSNFDYNGNYLIVNAETVTKIYTLNGNHATQYKSDIATLANSPVAINKDNLVFYITSDNRLCKSTVEGVSSPIAENIVLSDHSVDIIANQDYVYYIGSDNFIYRVKIAVDVPTAPQKLTVDTTAYDYYDRFDLGNINSPTGLCFKGDNLFITDSNGAQEFSIKEDKLVFTGFAVSSKKTAFNRISVNANDIERFKDVIAVLDSSAKRITTINLTDLDPYSKNSFTNKFFEETPKNIAVGDGTLLVTFDDASIKLFNNNYKLLTAQTITGVIDVCYQSGNYYLLTSNNIYKINENDYTISNEGTANTKNFFAIDVGGNLHFADEKICTDLLKKEFSMPTAKTFTLSFDQKKVYFLKANDEILYVTENLDNLSVDSVEVPLDYVISGSQAKQELNLCKIKQGANAYLVSTQDNFEFIDLSDTQTDKVLICKAHDGDFFVLAGTEGILLVDANDISENIPIEQNEIDKKVYITTDVYSYYLPLLSKDDVYVLKTPNSHRLVKGSQITVLSVITVSDREFYLAQYERDGKLYNAYLPTDFTTLILSKDAENTDFTLSKVNETNMYFKEEMTGKSIALAKDSEVRVYEIKGGVAKIGYLTEEGIVVGYIYEGDIIVNDIDKITIRNIVIVLIISASVCASTAFFVLRKKKD